MLTRLVMNEALLVTPVLGTFVITEFIMTMGAEDFSAFIVSYFIETVICLINRVYIGPFVEHVEAMLFRSAIEMSKKYPFFQKALKGVLTRMLAG